MRRLASLCRPCLLILIHSWFNSVLAARIRDAIVLQQELDRTNASTEYRVTGPLFDQEVFPSFLKPLASKERPLKPACGKSLETVVRVTQPMLTEMRQRPAEYFEPAFFFEGENVKCGNSYTKLPYDHDQCRQACARDASCTGYVYFQAAVNRFWATCGPCHIYNLDETRNCAPEFQEPTSCTGEFIGAYSKTTYLQSGDALGAVKSVNEFSMAQGLRLIRVGKTALAKQQSTFEATETVEHTQWLLNELGKELGLQDHKTGKKRDAVDLAFEVGVDLRGCWGELTDLGGLHVCSRKRMDELLQDLYDPSKQPKQDTAGQSGSTLIPNYKNFIIKNLMDDPEFELLRRSVPEFLSARANRGYNCFGTAIAPVCAVMIQQDKAKWIFMRKIEVSGAEKLEFPNNRGYSHSVSWIDIKGPYFAEHFMDGKSQLAKLGVYTPPNDEERKGWKHKDPGFVDIFPSGWKLKGCGCRDAAMVLALDTGMLAAMKMTDYSLFGAFYESPISLPSVSEGCVCGTSGKPTFPILLEVEPTDIPLRANGASFYVALGLIDYIEQRVNTGAISRRFSTMKEADEYRAIFMRMWPKYFQVPERRFTCIDDCKVAGQLVAAGTGMPAERLKVGTTVAAITEIKWTSSKRTLEPESCNYYYNLMDARLDGSHYKILPGLLGTIERFITHFPNEEADADADASSTSSIVVRWILKSDTPPEEQKCVLFRVDPEQIVPLRRKFL